MGTGFARRVLFPLTLLTTALATACGGSDSTTAPPPEEETEAPPDRTAASIELLTDSVRPMGMLGVTFQARARGRNAAGEVILSKLAAWSTDTPDVLEVTPEGEVRSLSEGEGRVIARLDGAEGVIRVPVREVARLEWQASLGAAAVAGLGGGPAIGPNGTVYVSGFSGALGGDDQFWAFEPSGSVRWSLVTPGAYPMPAIGPDGKLYFGIPRTGSEPGELSATDPDGTKLWGLPRPESVQFPALDANGVLYAMQRDNDDVVLLAVDAGNGAMLWEYRVTPETPVFSMPTLGLDDAVYFSTAEGTLWAVNTDGDPIWSMRPGGKLSFAFSPVVGMDGTIYVGSLDHRLYALSPDDGSVRWSLDFGYDVRRSVAIGADGTIYQAVENVLYAISPGGDILWNWTMDGAFLTSASPVVGGDGTVYVGAIRGLFAIDLGGALKWDFDTNRAVDNAPAIGLDGTVYFAADSTLYAIRELEENNGGFDASPWPVWRGNRQNTGRAGP